MAADHRPRSVAEPPAVVMALGAAIAVAGSLMPWVRTGARSRNSYDVFELVERLGFSPGGVEAAALRWWPVMPLLVIAAAVAAAWGSGLIGGTLGVAGGVYAGGVASVVAVARPGTGVEIGAGALVTAIGGWVLFAGSIAELVVSVRRSRSEDLGA